MNKKIKVGMVYCSICGDDQNMYTISSDTLVKPAYKILSLYNKSSNCQDNQNELSYKTFEQFKFFYIRKKNLKIILIRKKNIYD